MVQISLFDFQGPPKPLNGEAFTLSPLDVLAFVPVGPAVKTGEKLTTGLLTQIGKIFAPKVITSTRTALTIGGRAPGAPFRQGAAAIPDQQAIGFISQPAANTIAKSSSFAFPKLVKGPVNSNLLTIGAISAGAFGTTALLTQTEGGQDLTKDVTDVTKGISQFITDNPLIVAGGIAVLGVMILK